MSVIRKSNKLINVCYDIRGPVLQEAKRLEEEGQRIIKLNIGNPAPFGFDAPEEIVQDVIYNLPSAQGYCDSKGLFSARKAVMQECQKNGIRNVAIEDIYLGNGVSELIVMATQGLLNDNDELLIPAPDYPLWTAAASLAGGNPVHYLCNEEKGWTPDIDDIRSKITERTKGIVVINPNNPTGAVYPEAVLRQIIALAEEFGLIVFADEIYDKITYNGARHIPMASLSDDILCITFNGLSKAYRAAGFRSGWMVLTGPKHHARDYIEGLEMLASMRLCANVPAQHAIQTALGGYQSINELTVPGGRLHDQCQLAWQKLNDIPGVSCVKPQGALYLFARLDPEIYPIKNDEKLALDLLQQQKVLIVQGSGFNVPDTQHFRLVFLPREDELCEAIDRIAMFLKNYSQE
ncbi:pyridoxal phosphate-dependent aminotransferase [Amphritea pacifica]|uniref:alanine transaminase n=1 Tax=Amphritea pacifica TaxID=2811233 RepID=A0ABS2W3F6_9GAMM|nr:pyridoxal phosphate-dependent aminotransferase [Amphritea pacifica]MBN0986037.1 pyridoxal phosphate-dependent aminotransferase [Amphritea pacifica]MBN1006817.1 pyridoxal phosphate-dependent aminotransferase [Amphritea pacifica]